MNKHRITIVTVLLAVGLLSWYFLPAREAPLQALSDEPYHPRVIALQTTGLQAASPTAQPGQTVNAGPLDQAAVRLAARLAKQPDDVDGWVLLAQTYNYLQRPQEAREAMARARAYGYTGAGLDQRRQGADGMAAPGVFGRVKLASAVASSVQPGEALFVYAKAVDGPEIPLASKRYRVADLPLDFALDDAMAMMPTLKLSAYPRVRVFARISHSGQVTPSKGDLQGQSEIVNPAKSPRVEVIIDTVL